MKYRPPCKDCEKRNAACHTRCEEYKEYAADMIELRRKKSTKYSASMIAKTTHNSLKEWRKKG